MSEPNEIWFARRFPLGDPRKSMAPVHWKGWLMFGVFLAAMIVGALGFLLSALNGKPLMGALVFASLAAMGGGMLLIAVAANGDQTKTIDEYRTKNA